MATKKNKVSIGTFDRDTGKPLLDDIDKYCKLQNEHKPKGYDNIDRTKLIRNYFHDLLDGVVLDNKFYEFDNKYYFKIDELFREKETKAFPTISSKPRKYTMLYGIPNNLDKYSYDHKSYCYNNNKNEHKGIDVALVPKENIDCNTNNFIKLKPEDMEINYIIHHFHEDIVDISLVGLDELEEVGINVEDYEDVFVDMEGKIKDVEYDLKNNELVVAKYLVDNFLDNIGIYKDIKKHKKEIDEVHNGLLNDVESNSDKVKQLREEKQEYKELCNKIEFKINELWDAREKFHSKFKDVQENPTEYPVETIEELNEEVEKLDLMLKDIEELEKERDEKYKELDANIEVTSKNVNGLWEDMGLLPQDLMDKLNMDVTDENFSLDDSDKKKLVEGTLPHIEGILTLVKNRSDNEDLNKKLDNILQNIHLVTENEKAMEIMRDTLKKNINKL